MSEQQHHCAGCEGLTDESELQYVEIADDYYCQECINRGRPEEDAAEMDDDEDGDWVPENGDEPWDR